MNEPTFWELIERSRQLVNRAQCEDGQAFHNAQSNHLKQLLMDLSPAEIIAFDGRFGDMYDRAYTWDLWAVAYWLHGGCSDDGFLDFRACLISVGRERFTRAVNDPDGIVEWIDADDVPFTQSEGFQYIASEAYEGKTGRRMDRTPAVGHRKEPAGHNFDFNDTDEMRRRFPRLTATLPEGGG